MSLTDSGRFGRFARFARLAAYLLPVLALALAATAVAAGGAPSNPAVLSGAAAYGDWRTNAPLVIRRITVADLPPPGQTPSVANFPNLTPRPTGVWPQVPAGFKVDLFAAGFTNPRMIRAAPDGDIFLSDSRPGRIYVLRARDGAAKAGSVQVYASGLRLPFGIAFYPPGPNPQFLYVADNDALLRFPYHNGDLRAAGPPTTIAALPEGGVHWTRDVVVSAAGAKLFVSVGSGSNDATTVGEDERRRADILQFNPDGSGERIYASGLRNAVSIAIDPQTGRLFCAVNERDTLGDNLPPDYVTRVTEGGFYGWPWFYIGPHQDPYHAGQHEDLKSRVLIPDVLLQPHSAPLGMAFYTAQQFPAAYRQGAFVGEHGSWNRSQLTGYKVVFVPIFGGVPQGDAQDFMTGFITPRGQVWGRPVAVAVAHDGALLVSDDGSGSIWRVAYGNSHAPAPKPAAAQGKKSPAPRPRLANTAHSL
jgi:glucose/arabinose dehydrogenase